MKHLAIFTLTLIVATTAFGASSEYCHNITNTWTLSNGINGGAGNSTWTLTQDSSGNITGTIKNFYCPVAPSYSDYTLSSGSKYLGDGIYDGINGSQYKIDAPDNNPPTGCAFFDVVMIPLGTTGCATASETAYTPVQAMTASACLLPNGGSNGENPTTYVGRDINDLFHFHATLKVPTGLGLTTYSWSGRTVTSVNSGEAQTCSPVGITIYNDTPDYINDTNTVDDRLGWEYNAAGLGNIWQVRAKDSVLPCTVRYTETMKMDCPIGTATPYATYSNLYEVFSKSDNLASVTRNNSTRVDGVGVAPLDRAYRSVPYRI